MCERDTTGFGFTSDLLTKCANSFQPITSRSDAKLMQTRITFDTQVKTSLSKDVNSLNKRETKLEQVLAGYR